MRNNLLKSCTCEAVNTLNCYLCHLFVVVSDSFLCDVRKIGVGEVIFINAFKKRNQCIAVLHVAKYFLCYVMPCKVIFLICMVKELLSGLQKSLPFSFFCPYSGFHNISHAVLYCTELSSAQLIVEGHW